MKSILNICGPVILLLLGLSFAFGQKPAPDVTVPDSIQLPEVQGWTAGAKIAIPGETDGVAASYDSPQRERVTVYIYKRGDGAAKGLSGVVKEEFDGAREAIRTIADLGVYTDVKESKTETAPVGGSAGKVKALRVGLTFKTRGTPMTSEIYVFPYKGYIVKLRATRPATLDKTQDEGYARLLTALDSLFSQ